MTTSIRELREAKRRLDNLTAEVRERLARATTEDGLSGELWTIQNPGINLMEWLGAREREAHRLNAELKMAMDRNLAEAYIEPPDAVDRVLDRIANAVEAERRPQHYGRKLRSAMRRSRRNQHRAVRRARRSR